MQEWEDHFNAMEEAAENECRLHRKRMGLGKDTDEDCEDKPCSDSCPLKREPTDA